MPFAIQILLLPDYKVRVQSYFINTSSLIDSKSRCFRTDIYRILSLMANLVAEASRVHAHAIRNAMRSGNYHGAENQLATLRHSLPLDLKRIPHPRERITESFPSLRLPLHAYIHGLLRQRRPVDHALREVVWMLTWGLRIRGKTMQTVFLSALEKEGEGTEQAIEEPKAQNDLEALGDEEGSKGDPSEPSPNLRGNTLADHSLRKVIDMLTHVRMNEHTGPTWGLLGMYRSLMRACIRRDEFVAAALVFEMMIDDWVRWLSAPATPAATNFVAPPVSDVGLGQGSLHQAKSDLLTPLQFADRSHVIFTVLCNTLKERLRKLIHPRSTKSTVEDKRLQSNISQASCILASLFNLRLLPYTNIHPLLDVIFWCNRVPSCTVLVRTDFQNNHVSVGSHSYLSSVVTSLVRDLSSRNLSSIPEISEVIRSKIMLLPNFSVLSYRTLLYLVFNMYGDPELARKVILLMVPDQKVRRSCLDSATCRSLTKVPTRLKMIGLDPVVYNYVWNKAGVEPEPPTYSTILSSSQRQETKMKRP